MARKRDYKKEYVKRQEIAREKGYQSYYDYRLHGYGKEPATAPQAKGRLREQLTRGSREKIDKLYDHLRAGEVEMINRTTTKRGTSPELEILVTLDDGSQKEYKLRGKKQVGDFYGFMDDFPEDYPDIEPPLDPGS